MVLTVKSMQPVRMYGGVGGIGRLYADAIVVLINKNKINKKLEYTMEWTEKTPKRFLRFGITAISSRIDTVKPPAPCSHIKRRM